MSKGRAFYILDKYGWPVETIRGRPITNLMRLVIHGRRIIGRAEWQRRQQAKADRDTGCTRKP